MRRPCLSTRTLRPPDSSSFIKRANSASENSSSDSFSGNSLAASSSSPCLREETACIATGLLASKDTNCLSSLVTSGILRSLVTTAFAVFWIRPIDPSIPYCPIKASTSASVSEPSQAKVNLSITACLNRKKSTEL